MELRPYQQKAVDAVFNSWREFSKTLLVLPTGTGKTVVFSKVAERALNEGDGKILVLAHREELLTQARDKIYAATNLPCAFEKAGESSLDSLAPITCASVQTLMRKPRLNRFSPRHYDNSGRSPPRLERFIPKYFGVFFVRPRSGSHGDARPRRQAQSRRVFSGHRL